MTLNGTSHRQAMAFSFSPFLPVGGNLRLRYDSVSVRAYMSEIRRYTITNQMLLEAKKEPASIQKFFSLLGWEPSKNESIPSELQKLVYLKGVEGWLSISRKNYLFFIISPVLAYMYAQQEVPSLIWILVLLSIPVFFVGVFGLYTFQTGWFGKQLDVLKSGFVVLIGDALIENLPQHRFLLFEERRLERLLVQVQQKIQQLRDVHQKLLQKSRELNEDSSRLSASMHQEQELLHKAEGETKALLSKVREHLTLFEQQRKQILNRAELEYIRHQARALSQEEQQQFSQHALADLEVDSISLGRRIEGVEQELGKIGIHFQVENELSR